MAHNSHANNTYLTYTKDSYPKADEFATNSQGTINNIGLTMPAVAAKGSILQPFTDDVNDNYLLYRSKWNISLRATKKEKLTEIAMIAILRQFDIDLQHLYNETTDEYNTVFVKTRSALYEGLATHTQVLNYKVLSIAAGLYPTVATLKTAFDAKVTAYDLIIKAAADAKTNIENQSVLMEAARVKWCVKAHGTTGAMMEIFEETPERIDDIFNLAIFDTRHTHIDPDKGAIVISLPVNGIFAWNEPFDPTKTYQIHNTGFGSVDLGSAASATALTIPNPQTLAEDETKIFEGGELGDMSSFYLLFKNNDTFLPGEIKIKIVPTQV